LAGMVAGNKGVDPKQLESTQQELARLRELSSQQQAQFQAAQQQTQQMLEAQQRQLMATSQQSAQQEALQLKNTMAELAQSVNTEDLDPDELDLPIKSWIESS